MKGKIAWVNHKKKFGFIKNSEEKLYFFREYDIYVNEDEKVVFDVKNGEKGEMAVNIKHSN